MILVLVKKRCLLHIQFLNEMQMRISIIDTDDHDKSREWSSLMYKLSHHRDSHITLLLH
jgi:hypothetical protein